MESSIAVFLLRQPACERLPTTPHRRLTEPKAAAKPPHQRARTEHVIQTQGATPKLRDMRACKLRPTRGCPRRHAANNACPHHTINDHHRT